MNNAQRGAYLRQLDRDNRQWTREQRDRRAWALERHATPAEKRALRVWLALRYALDAVRRRMLA
jgi:hypothetical protein